MAKQLEGKVAILTGGNSGIGLSTAHKLVAAGAEVAILDTSPTPSERVPSSAKYIQCDVADEESVNTAVKEAVDHFSHIDILINCAGVMDNFAPTGSTSTQAWTKVLSINLNGPFFLIRACLPYLLSNPSTAAPDTPPSFSMRGEPLPPTPPPKGVIVNIASVAAAHGGTAGTAYTTSKHALLGLSRSTAYMYRDKGIRCNVVLPGPTMTNIAANSAVANTGGAKSGRMEMDEEGMGRCGPMMALAPQAILSPEKVAGVVVWLCGEWSDGVVGGEIVVDGGWTTG